MKRTLFVLAALACLAAGASAVVEAEQLPRLDQVISWLSRVQQAPGADQEFESAEDELKAIQEQEAATRRAFLKALADAKWAAARREELAATARQLAVKKEAEDRMLDSASPQLLADFAATNTSPAAPKSAWHRAGKLPVMVPQPCRPMVTYRPIEWDLASDALRFGDTREALTNPALINAIIWDDWRSAR